MYLCRYSRWINERNSHVFVNHSKSLSLIQFHDCNIRLDPDDPRAPWPVLFAYHEGLVRARFPWPSPCISFPKVITKVVSTVGLTKSSKRDSDSFMNSEQTPKRPRYHGMHNESEAPQARSQAHTTTLYALSSSKPTLPEVQHQVIKVGDDEDYYEDWHTSVSQSSATMPISEAVNYPKKPETNPVPYHGLPQLRPQVLQPFKFDSTEHLRRYFGEDEMKEQGFRNWYLPVEDEE